MKKQDKLTVLVEILDLKKLVAKTRVLDQVIDLYIRAFREPPWNEDFYTPYSVFLEITQELSNSGAAIFIKRDKVNGKVIAFGWGYPSSSTEALSKAKYRGKMAVIAGNVLDKVIQGSSFWYTSEVVTDSNFRGRGIATELVLAQEQYAKNKGLGFVVLRTSSDSPMSYIARVKANMILAIGPELQVKDITPNYERRVLYIKEINRRLDQELLNSKAKRLYKAILSLETERESENFLRNILTEVELKEIVNRLEIVGLLRKRAAYKDITDKTGASSTTIAKLSKKLRKKPISVFTMAAVA